MGEAPGAVSVKSAPGCSENKLAEWKKWVCGSCELRVYCFVRQISELYKFNRFFLFLYTFMSSLQNYILLDLFVLIFIFIL